MLGILYEKKFVPIAIGVFSHETMDVFKMVFEWIDANTDTAPTNLMADGDEGCRSSALTVWPSIVLLMCSWHQKKASEKHMKDINVAYKLLEIEVDKELMTILRKFFRYFSDEWIICTRKKVSVRKPPRADNEQLLGENEQNFQGNNVFL